MYDEAFRKELFRSMTAAQSARGKKGNLRGATSSAFSDETRGVPASQVLSAEQSNSSMLFDNKFFLKLYRKLEDGVNPDVEVTRFLTERAKFPNVPAFLGRDRISPDQKRADGGLPAAKRRRLTKAMPGR